MLCGDLGALTPVLSPPTSGRAAARWEPAPCSLLHLPCLCPSPRPRREGALLTEERAGLRPGYIWRAVLGLKPKAPDRRVRLA